MGLARGNNHVLVSLGLPVLSLLCGLLRYRNLTTLYPMLVQPFAPLAKRPMSGYLF
jgi:hypothetical protein